MYLHQRHLLISLSAGPDPTICYRPPAAVEIYHPVHLIVSAVFISNDTVFFSHNKNNISRLISHRNDKRTWCISMRAPGFTLRALGTTITDYTDNPCPPHQTLIIHHKAPSASPRAARPSNNPFISMYQRERRGDYNLVVVYNWDLQRVARRVYMHLRWICSDPSVYLYFIAQSMMMLSSIHLAVYVLKATTRPLYACMPA